MQVINNNQLWNILVLSPSVSTHKQQRTAVLFAKKKKEKFLLAIYVHNLSG